MPNDILLDENYDLKITNGDFTVGESTRQHQAILLLCEKGENREFPTLGVGVNTWLLEETMGDLNSEIKREFARDGMNVQKVKIEDGQLNIIAQYE